MSDDVGHGFHSLAESGNEFNGTAAVVEKMLSQTHTATVVKVVSVTNDGGVSPVGYVDVLPLVKQIDGKGRGHSHSTVYHLPYFRLQGGVNAIILDPKAGDLGLAVFASRDISNVKANKNESLPGSFRSHSMSDGLYIGGFLNGSPNQYVMFEDSGITMSSPTKVTINAPEIDLNANAVKIAGSSLTHNNINVGSTHRHTDPQGGNTDVPH